MQTKTNWFEIPSTDFQRAVKFYETVFETKLRVEEFGDGPLGIFAGPEGGVGCVTRNDGHRPAENGPLLYLDAPAGMDNVLARVEAAGGRIALKKTMLPGEMGCIARFIDSEGNRLALHAMH